MREPNIIAQFFADRDQQRKQFFADQERKWQQFFAVLNEKSWSNSSEFST